MNQYQVQKLFVWSGIVAVTLFFLGIVLAGFFPPPSPSLGTEAVISHYQQHLFGIRAGMVLTMISGMFMAPLIGVISEQLRRIPKVSRSVVYAQVAAGTMGAVFFFPAPLIFLVAAFRPDRAPEITYMLNDFAWIMLVLPWPPACIQNVVIGLGVLNDKSANPVFPRWVGYFNFWVALGFIPGGLLPFFHTGPFAWNGIFAFWLAGSVFFVWFVVMTVMLLKAVNRQQADEAQRV